eukprot:2517079-Pleurochrysis_carterae.AAC.1
MVKNVATAGRTPNIMAAPERRSGTQQLESLDTTPATAQPPMPTPQRAQPKIPTAAWVAMSMAMTMAAFAAGSAHMFEGLTAAKLTDGGIGAILGIQKASRAFAATARRAVCTYPILTYTVMAIIIVASSQPATHARVASAWRSTTEGAYALGRGITR